jgi:hypothetical protein
MASSEVCDSWFFYSKSKDLVPENTDRMKGFHVLFKWKDQGWGKQKSRVAVKVMNGTDEVFRRCYGVEVCSSQIKYNF